MKTLIVIDNLNTGGVASSLYNYLKCTSNKMECELIVFNETSIDLNRIPKNVKILKTNKLLHVLGKTHKEIMEESKLMAIYRLILVIISRIFNGNLARKLLWLYIKEIGTYDLAISYSQDDGWKSLSKGCNDFVLKKVKANHKAVIIHCDYKNFGGYNFKQEKIFKKFDSIICVSNSCKNSFKECFPDLESKLVVCENFIDVERVKKLSKNAIIYDKEKINFVSICRLSLVKGLDRTIDILKELKQEKINNFTWTIVGEGPEHKRLQKKVEECGLEDKILFVGEAKNPYKYLKNASALLITSIHEAAPMVYGESAVLRVPIVTVENCSAIELVEERKIGRVIPNDKEGIKDIIKKILKNNEILNEFYLINNDVNSNAIKQYNDYISRLK